MEAPDQRDVTAVVGLFLQQFARDRSRGATIPLQEYQARFPGFENEIASEFAALQNGGPEREGTEPEGTEAQPSHGPRYQVGDEIARGGMGAVFQVWDQNLHRNLAMKVLLPGDQREAASGSRDPQALRRFLQEAQVTGQLEHPGIVPVHELGLDDSGRVFFTMSLVRGEDLKQIIDHVHGPGDEWNLTRALHAILRVCEAMAFAHDRGIVHRDLKPANVMVGQFGETYVMDWGLARVLQDAEDSAADGTAGDDGSPDTTLPGDVFGTPAYMPPEQARGDVAQVGPAADVYAIGAMLYHLLSGVAPYRANGGSSSSKAVLEQVLAGPPAPVSSLARQVPQELIAICEKAMARDPGRRYASVQALGEDLRAFLETRVVSAYEVGAIAELRKWVQRNRATALASAAAVLMLVIGLVATFVLKQQADDNANTAEASFELALSAVEEMLSEVGEKALRNVPHSSPARRRLLETAATFQDQLLKLRHDDATARQAIARTKVGVGFIHSLLGDFDKAEPAYREAIRGFEELLMDSPDNRKVAVRLGMARTKLGILLNQHGRSEQAMASFESARKGFDSLLAIRPEDEACRGERAQLLDAMANSLDRQKQLERSLEVRDQAVADWRRLAKQFKRVGILRSLGLSLRNRGVTLTKLKQPGKAEASLNEATGVFEEALSLLPTSAEAKHGLAATLSSLEQLQQKSTGSSAAEATLRRGIQIRRELATQFPHIPVYRSELGGNLHNLGNRLAALQNYKEARTVYLEALGHQVAALRLAPGNRRAQTYLAYHRNAICSVSLRFRLHREVARQAVALGPNPPGGVPKSMASHYLGRCAQIVTKDPRLSASEREALARKYADQSMTLLQQAVRHGFRNTQRLRTQSFDPIRKRDEFKKLLQTLRGSK